MKLLVTGGSGFIGSNFIYKFINKYKIMNYDNLTYAGNRDNLKSIENKQVSPSGIFIDISVDKNGVLLVNREKIVYLKKTNLDQVLAEKNLDNPLLGYNFFNAPIYSTLIDDQSFVLIENNQCNDYLGFNLVKYIKYYSLL